MTKPTTITQETELSNQGHNFQGPGNECFYCGYEEDECLRYELNCDRVQRLEMRKMLTEQLKTLTREIMMIRGRL